MQINSSNSLPILTGFNRPSQRNQQNTPQENNRSTQRTQEPLEGQIVQSQFASTGLTTHSVRPTSNTQPLFDQQLTQSGEQARHAYQSNELAGEVELANRLDVIV